MVTDKENETFTLNIFLQFIIESITKSLIVTIVILKCLQSSVKKHQYQALCGNTQADYYMYHVWPSADASGLTNTAIKHLDVRTCNTHLQLN